MMLNVRLRTLADKQIVTVNTNNIAYMKMVDEISGATELTFNGGEKMVVSETRGQIEALERTARYDQLEHEHRVTREITSR